VLDATLADNSIAILNAGGWGTALAVLLASAGRSVSLWARRPEAAEQLDRARENRAYLPGIAIPPSVLITSDLAAAVRGRRAVVLVTISRGLAELARRLVPLLQPDQLLVHGTKGFEPETLLGGSAVVERELGPAFTGRTAVISGPTLASEVALGAPTAAVLACPERSVGLVLQQLLIAPSLRLYANPDRVGVETCGALKNVVALAAGASDGLGYGDDAKAALITRSLAEMRRLVVALGGQAETVNGLAGLGDIIATCTSRHSRNRWAGEQIGRGRSIEEVVASTQMVVEGVPATRAALALAERHTVELPIAEQVHAVLFGGRTPREALSVLMGRNPTWE
jgi:glycerol-3-phosphate dehydrogenase (NAD(P)+)